MPTYDTPNSSSTYTTPDGADNIEISILGSGGGSGGDGYDFSSDGRSDGAGGGIGGSISGTFPVSGNESYTVYIAEPGGNAGVPNGGAAGASPYASGGSGGDGGSTSAGGGGGAGGVTAVVRDSDGAVVASAGGAGGGGGGVNVGGASVNGGGGGGGGARGGAGGAGGDGDNYGANGDDGELSGAGGNGGDGEGNSQAVSAGADGGSTSHPDFNVDSSSVGGGNSGAGQVVINDPPAAPSLSVEKHDETSVTLDIGSTSGENGTRVYYRESGSASWSLHTTLSSGTVPTKYTVTNLLQGTNYDFYVEVYNNVGTSSSGIVTEQTDASSPTFDSLNIVNSDQLEYNWTRGGTDEIAYRVFISTDNGSTFSQINGDLSGTTESYTTVEKLDGTTYHGKVVAVYNDVTRESNVLSNTTNIPDISTNDITPLDASIEDQLTVQNPKETDNGTYEAEIRITGSGDPFGSTISEPYDGNDFTFTNLLDGEKYDIRVRAICNDESTDWTSVSDVTILPADTNLNVTDKLI